MRITIRIAASGSRAYLDIPDVLTGSEECLNERGKVDPKKAAKLLQKPGIMCSSEDPFWIQIWGWEILRKVDIFLKENDYDLNHPATQHAKRRMDSGKFAYVRIDLRRSGGKWVHKIGYKLANHPQAVTAQSTAANFVEMLNKIADSVLQAMELAEFSAKAEQLKGIKV